MGATSEKVDFYDCDLTGPLAIVMGGEEVGLTTDIKKLCDYMFRIPLHESGVDSLNVSVAAGIAMFERVRQKQLKK